MTAWWVPSPRPLTPSWALPRGNDEGAEISFRPFCPTLMISWYGSAAQLRATGRPLTLSASALPPSVAR